MGSSLNNTDTSYRDSDEVEYAPKDVFCPYAETTSNKGQLNAYLSGCETKLAMEEIPQACCKCKGIKFKRIMPDVDSLICVCGEDKKIGELHCEFCAAIHEIDYSKPGAKEKNCDRCNTPLTNMKKKYCEDCRIVVDKEQQERKNERKRKTYRENTTNFGY